MRNLFYNVPARLKFVKTHRAETSAIDKLIRAYAYIQPEVSFKLFSDERLVFSSPSNTQSLARAHALLGQDTKGLLHEINTKTELIKSSGRNYGTNADQA